MFQNKISDQTSSNQNIFNEQVEKNENLIPSKSKDKIETDKLSNSGTSISSNKDVYKNFVSKIKLNYHLKNPDPRTQTIILHTSLDKSYSEINDSFLQNDNNIEQKSDDYNNPNLNNETNSNNLDKLNTAFIMDNSSQNSNNLLTINNKKDSNSNKKRNELNYINNIYEGGNEKILENSEDINNSKNNFQGNTKKDNLTINFNNNMFFLNDNNNIKNLPLNSFPKNKKSNEDTFKDKVFISDNPFEDKYPYGMKNEDDSFENKNNIIYNTNNGEQNLKDDNLYEKNKMLSGQNRLKPGNSISNDLSTNLNTLPQNIEYDPNINNKGISPFKLSMNSSSNLGFSLNDKNIDNNSSKYLQGKTFPQNIIPNNAIENEPLKINEVSENNQNYPPQLKNDLFPGTPEQTEEPNNYDTNNNQKKNIINSQFTFDPNRYNSLLKDNNNSQQSDIQTLKYISPGDNIHNNEEILLTNNIVHSLSSSFDNSEISEKEDNSEKNNALKSLLYGLLIGSAATGLFWLKNEETRKYFLEKFKGINFNSIIKFFKSLSNPFAFIKKVTSDEKREVYLKVLGVSLGKVFDFFEKYGDGFRLLGTFLVVYSFWLVIKSLIKTIIKTWKKNK